MRESGCFALSSVLMFSLIGFGFYLRSSFWQYSLGFCWSWLLEFLWMLWPNVAIISWMKITCEVVEWRSLPICFAMLLNLIKQKLRVWFFGMSVDLRYSFVQNESARWVQDIHLENKELERFVWRIQSLHFAGGVDLLNSLCSNRQFSKYFLHIKWKWFRRFDGGGFSGGGGGGGGELLLEIPQWHSF